MKTKTKWTQFRIRDLIKIALKENKTYVDFEMILYRFINRKFELEDFEKLVFDSSGNFGGGYWDLSDITKFNIGKPDRKLIPEVRIGLRTLIEKYPLTSLFIYDNDGFHPKIYKIKVARFEIDADLGT